MDEPTTNPFDALVPEEPVETNYSVARAMLEQLRQTIDKRLGQHGSASVVPGFATNLGVQHRLRISIPSVGLDDSLLEVYIPLEGQPCVLNTYAGGAWQQCETPDALLGALSDAVSKGPVADRLRQIIGIARQAA